MRSMTLRGLFRRWCSGSSLRGSGGNIPDWIWERSRFVDKLHVRHGHPLCTIRGMIEAEMLAGLTKKGGGVHVETKLDPVVTSRQCFDELLVGQDHPSRSESDTYFLDGTKERVLRTHMTAHDTELLRKGARRFIISGDVYRRDAVDRSHYPIFHQMDGVNVFERANRKHVEDDLKETLSSMARNIFGKDANIRWVPGSFPFTSPSFEMEIFWRGEWLEVLGCGELQEQVLIHGGLVPTETENRGWAFGLGLERLAMVLFDIPDIRLFWSEDERFSSQFQDGVVQPFRPYSKYPPCYKDIAFWVPTRYHENHFFELVRGIAGDLVESVEEIDKFARGDRLSLCYRVVYRSMDRSLTNEEIDSLQDQVRAKSAAELGVTLR